MEVTSILAEIDSQISKLQQARALLAGTTTTITASAAPAVKKAKRGRPKGSKNSTSFSAAAAPAASTTSPKKRKLSPEGRKRIADAMKKRWAEKRKQAGKS